MLEDLNKAKSAVKRILDYVPETRDSDMLLLIKVWEAQGLYFTEWQRDFMMKKVINPESIRRVRQQFQHDGFYVGTNRKAKKDEEGVVRKWSRGQGIFI